MNNIRSVFIGNFSLSEEKVYSLKSYAQFYNELVRVSDGRETHVFAGYFLRNDPGFEFSFEQNLSSKIDFTLSRGNTSTTRLMPFLWNNLLLFIRLTCFCFKKGDYFIFLPSPIGVWGVLIVTLFRKANTLGVYIGGHYGREQSFEKREGNIKKKIKNLSAIFVDRLVLYAIKKSDYVITSSYEYFHHHESTGKIFLTPPMLNVDATDLNHPPVREQEKYITFCGELRHAKGVIDLLKAFALLVNNKKIANYKLKIIGSGQAHDELFALADKHGIMDMVIFCGQIKEKEVLKAELASSSIFVLPSYSEGFPRVAYECFALGVPTILTPVGGIPFLVKDGAHCLFSEPGNVDDLANKICQLLEDSTLRRNIASAARQLMREKIFPRIESYGSLGKMVIEGINQTKNNKDKPVPNRKGTNTEHNMLFRKTY
jgi:glycosyltransferase involved in cell wall biosynthesis